MPVVISVDGKDLAVAPKWLQLLKQAGEETLKQEGAAEAELSVLLVDDTGIQELNRIWRGIDAPTDVLSFALREGDDHLPLPVDQELLGDVVISVERAVLQAKEYGNSAERELAFLLTHGILHLLGYDHQTRIEEERMRTRQEAILTALGLSR